MVADKVEAIYVASGAHHLRFQRLDIGYTMSNAIQWSTHEAGQYSSYLELLDSRIHHAGQTTRDSGHGGPGINNGYGIYLFTDDNLVQGNEFYSNCGIAINAYGNRNVISYNTAYGNGTRGGPAPAINIGSSAYPGMTNNTLVDGNVVFGNRAGVQIYSNTVNTVVSNNTIYANQVDGLLLAYFDSVYLRNNAVYGNGESDVRNEGGGAVYEE
jgi:parallel beta-helix repeat protein